MKRLKAIKAGIARGTRVGALVDMILDGSWTLAISEVEGEAEKPETATDNDIKITFRQPQKVSSSTPDTTAAVLQ